MARWGLFGAGVFLTGALFASGAFAAGPAMSVNWADVGSDQDACVRQASAALRQNEFSTNFEVVSNRTIYGERGDYTAAIRCVADKAIAFVAVSGSNGDQTGTYATAIRDAISPAQK